MEERECKVQHRAADEMVLRHWYIAHEAEVIRTQAKRHGYDCGNDIEAWSRFYYGMGHDEILRRFFAGEDAEALAFIEDLARDEPVRLDFARLWDTRIYPPRRNPAIHYIPARRDMALSGGAGAGGWPPSFDGFAPGTPYLIREFSQRLRTFLNREYQRRRGIILPSDRLAQLSATRTSRPPEEADNESSREMDLDTLLHGLELKVVRANDGRLILVLAHSYTKGGNGAYNPEPIPYASWTPEQQFVIPLLVSLLSLLPTNRRRRMRSLVATSEKKWIAVEYPYAFVSSVVKERLLEPLFEALNQNGYELVFTCNA